MGIVKHMGKQQACKRGTQWFIITTQDKAITRNKQVTTYKMTSTTLVLQN